MVAKRKHRWYCYLCHKPILRETNSHAFLISMAQSTDRVFMVCSSECLNQVEECFLLEIVENGTRMFVKRGKPSAIKESKE